MTPQIQSNSFTKTSKFKMFSGSVMFHPRTLYQDERLTMLVVLPISIQIILCTLFNFDPFKETTYQGEIFF